MVERQTKARALKRGGGGRRWSACSRPVGERGRIEPEHHGPARRRCEKEIPNAYLSQGCLISQGILYRICHGKLSHAGLHQSAVGLRTKTLAKRGSPRVCTRHRTKNKVLHNFGNGRRRRKYTKNNTKGKGSTRWEPKYVCRGKVGQGKNRRQRIAQRSTPQQTSRQTSQLSPCRAPRTCECSWK